ncbi:hypothetical protein ANAPC5_01422 [Anaplasma phagocytophilum]|nr:hypothetical protein ANAPC5_01422 [Anaplasma phagocytophilum]
MITTVNFLPVSDARKAAKSAAAAKRAEVAAAFDVPEKTYKLIQLVQRYPWIYDRYRSDHKHQDKRKTSILLLILYSHGFEDTGGGCNPMKRHLQCKYEWPSERPFVEAGSGWLAGCKETGKAVGCT